MKRGGRILLYLVLVLLLAGGGAAVFFMTRGGLGPQATPTPAPIKVLVIQQPVGLGEEITDAVLGTVELPPQFANNAVLIRDEQRAEILGQLAKFDLEPGIFLTRAMLAATAEDLNRPGSEAAKIIPRGMTAIAIPITRLSAAAFALRDGDHVDVIASMLFVDVDTQYQTILPNTIRSITGSGYKEGELAALTVTIGEAGGPLGRVEVDPVLQSAFYIVPAEGQVQRPRLVTQRILQNVEILRVGTFDLPSEMETPEPNAAQQLQSTPTPVPGSKPAAKGPDIITLIVTPQEAVTLTYLLYSNAELTLTLRSKGDEERVETESATLQFLIGQYNISLPAKLPYAMEPAVIELIPPTLPGDSLTISPQ